MLSLMRHAECVQRSYAHCAIRADIRGQDMQNDMQK